MRESPHHLADRAAPGDHRWFPAWRWFVVLLLMGAAVAANLTRAVAAEYSDVQVKAAYLFQFGSLVDWPAQKLSSPRQRIVIGVVGNPAVASELERRARTNEISSHKVVIRRLAPNADFSDCHILFIGQEQEGTQILNNIKVPGILTVGEHEKFATGGGVLNFIFVEGAVQYQANLEAAEKARLQLNSKLIDLARRRGQIIKTAPPRDTR